MAISHEQAQVRGRIGGLTKAARATDPRDLTRAANAARWQKYLDMVPAEITDPADRQRRAELFRSADMARLALRSSMVRSRAAKLRREAEQVAADLAAVELLDAPELTPDVLDIQAAGGSPPGGAAA